MTQRQKMLRKPARKLSLYFMYVKKLYDVEKIVKLSRNLFSILSASEESSSPPIFWNKIGFTAFTSGLPGLTVE
jgi:hypothetical protein